ncbi:MAG: heme exporter protein CcmB [Pseudomonadota bacterium]
MTEAILPSVGGLVLALVRRDLLLAVRGGGGVLQTLFFFLIFVGLSGFALGPGPAALRAAAPAIIWLGLLLAVQFSVLDLFRGDLEDGTLQVLAAEQKSLLPYVYARLLAAFISLAVPLALAVPVAFVMFSVELARAGAASLLLILASPALILAGVVAAAVSAGARTGGLLGMGLAAPLVVPILIFGIGAVEAGLGPVGAASNTLAGAQWLSPETLLLGAIMLFYGVILPPFAVLAIRLGLE